MSIFSQETLNSIFTTKQTRMFFLNGKFTCPFCHGVDAAYKGALNSIIAQHHAEKTALVELECPICEEHSLYIVTAHIYANSSNVVLQNEKLIYPDAISGEAPEAGQDMPDNVKKTYNEAAKILPISPRSSAALARVAVQELVNGLEPKGKDLNEKIGIMVRERGLATEVEHLLDSVRVIGNNAVHPGQIDLSNAEEAKPIAIVILNEINQIVQTEITNKNSFKKVYDMIPESILKSIKDRDTK